MRNANDFSSSHEGGLNVYKVNKPRDLLPALFSEYWTIEVLTDQVVNLLSQLKSRRGEGKAIPTTDIVLNVPSIAQ